MPRTRKISSSDEEDERKDDHEQEDEQSEDESKSDVENTDDCNEKRNKGPTQPDLARKVFIAHKSIRREDWGHVSTILLPHPRTRANTLFLFDTRMESAANENHAYFVYEVLTMVEDEGLSSWFTGNFVSSNGNLYVFTPMDPLFLILPAMLMTKQAKPFLDHLIEYFPLAFAKVMNQRLLPTQLLNVAIRKVSGDVEAYLFDEGKALKWLSDKVNCVANSFQEKNLTRSEASISHNFSRNTTLEADRKNEYLQYACDVVCEYLEDALKVKLHSTLGLPTDVERLKRKTSDVDEGTKRLKLDDGEVVTPLEDYGSSNTGPKGTPKGPGTAKQKQLQEAAKGTHSLLKFFTAKPKAK